MSSPLDVAPPFGGATCFPCTPAQLVENIYGKASAADFKGLKSAVRVVCRLLNKDPNTWVLNSAKDLVDAVHSVHPIRANVTPSYWTTTSSRVMAVLRRNGVEFLSGRCNTELPPEWARLIVAARLLDAARTRSLLPFFRDRFAIGRLPSDIAQLDFEEYCWRVDQLSNRKNKLAGKQAVQRDWNFFVSRIDGWPQVPFSFHNKRKDYLLPEHEMPPAVAEFDAKKRMPLRGNRKFSVRRRHLSPATIDGRCYQFRRIVSAAVRGGIDPKRLQTIADVCDPEVLEVAFNLILDRVEAKLHREVNGTCDVSRLAGLMLAVGEQWAGATGPALERLTELRDDFLHIQDGMAEKNQRLLSQFRSDLAIAEFLKTPARVMASYDKVGVLTESDCVEMQLAAAMALFTRVPVRMENMKQVVDGVHLVEHGWGSDRKVLLIFGSDEVKNSEYLETLLSARVVGVLDKYKEKAWPRLKRANTKYLFPGYGDNYKSASCFGMQLANFVRRHTGVRVTPHQFRHLCGYFHLRRHPGDYATVQKLLGHKRIETTIRFYTGTMDRVAAFEKYDAGIEARIAEAEEKETTKIRMGVK